VRSRTERERSSARRIDRRDLPWLVLGAAVLTLISQATRGGAQDASTAVYVRNDTDQTTVITPRLRVGGNVTDTTRLDVSYSVDVWTSASIDIRTSASKPITEQRDEINVKLGQEAGELMLSAGYRYSSEPDYLSNGGSLGISRDFADKSTTLALNLAAFFDTVGRVGDPQFAKSARSFTGRFSFTQVLDPQSVVQLIYELNLQDGYLSSPYRMIGIGSPDGSCVNASVMQQIPCIPETNPAARLRHAGAIRARRALGDRFSIGAGYRFYIDDWELMSHTADGELGYMPGSATLLSLRYRYYLQGAAFHYRARLDALKNGSRQFYTRDKELSPFTAHRIGLDLEHVFDLDDAGTRLRTAVSLGLNLYLYSDFLPLDRIVARELSVAMGLEL
jgi:hypothetical protein